MLMLFLHSLLWGIAAALAICCAVLAFKHKWYFVGVIDVSIAFIDVVMMIDTIVNYFIH